MLFIAATTPALLFAQEKFTAETLWKLGRVSDVQLSPDGGAIIYGVSKYDLATNKGNRDIYKLDRNAESPRQLTDFKGSEINAIWRPDGKKIGFLSAESGSMQMWEMGPNGENKIQVSNIEGGINGFAYSPDMQNIVYIKDVKIEEDIHDLYPDLPLADAMIYDDLMYRHWDSWHDYAYSHIFIAPYSDGKTGEGKDIMPGEAWDSPLMPWGGMEQITWAPDGKSLAYTCKKLKGKDYALSTNSDIYLYNLASGKTENLSESNLGYDQDPVFSPDGSKIVWRSMAEPGFEADKDRIMLCELNPREMDGLKKSIESSKTKSGKGLIMTSQVYTDLSEGFDQSSTNFSFSIDGKQLYFISGTQATFQVYRMDIASRKITQLTKGDHDIQAYAIDGKDLIITKMRHDLPSEVFRVKPDGTEEQLTFTNREVLKNITLAKSEKRWVTTTDGKKMLVWVILPPNFDPNKKYPALLYCQGGPQSAVSQFFSYRWNFQMMAAHDYVVVAPNRRGLPTFGQEWNNQISGDYGGQNMLDYFTAIDSISAEPWVDENRLGAVGASYGGYSVYWLAGNHNKRFKAFIAHCGIFNFESMYLETEEMFFVNKDYEGAYWKNPRPKSYDFSPHNFVKNWDTPMLVVHGGYDFRIPYTQGMQAFNANQLLGIPSRFLFFTEETHFVLKPQNAVLWQREFFRWLDTYLK
ncbi:MAG: peptidase S9 [Bacteroidetes bacterium HGW-Bacteroidetes-9]|nr:MAG: peptidase S9 [Bacteroidetes bacterium HGW-Bacteroidetes-9]